MGDGTSRAAANQKAGLERVAMDPVMIPLLAFTAALPFARPVLFHVGESGAMFADLLLMSVWLTAFVQFVRKKLVVRFDALFWLGIAYLAAQVLSLVVSHHLARSPLLKLTAFSELVLLPWLLRSVLTTTERVGLVMRVWFVAAAIAVLVGVVGFIAFFADRNGAGMAMMCGWGALPPLSIPRLCAPFNNPNNFLNYLTDSIPIAFYVFRERLTLAAWAFLGAAAFVGLFTLSAGVGGFALTSVVAFLVWRRYKGRSNRLVSGGLLAAASLVALFFMGTMLATLQPKGMGDIPLGPRDIKVWDGTRPSVWSTNRWLERPITGVGYGEYASLVTDPRCYIPSDKLAKMTEPIPPHLMDGHSIILNTLAQSGVVGLTALLALLVMVTRGVLWGRAKDLDPSIRYQRDLVAAILVGGFLFHGIFGSFEESRHLWLVFALGASLVAITKVPRPADPARETRST